MDMSPCVTYSHLHPHSHLHPLPSPSYPHPSPPPHAQHWGSSQLPGVTALAARSRYGQQK